MNVLIVGKTHLGAAACVGGMALGDGQSIRLLTDRGFNQPGDTKFDVGQVWDLDISRTVHTQPPHIEDALTLRQRFVSIDPNPRQSVLRFAKPWTGNPGQVFDGLVRATGVGSGYISHSVGLPARSTGYWIPDRALSQDGSERRYLYPSATGVRRLPYVGYAAMLAVIPAGTLLRVSLARWWKPEDADGELEERCYLQLSGWFV